MNTSILTPEEWFSQPRVIAGIMTGTSLDAIDSALVEFSAESDGNHRFKLLESKAFPYDFNLKQGILDLISKPTTIRDVTKIHYELSYAYSNAVKELMKLTGLKEIDAVSIHGQTVWHEPGTSPDRRMTFQLGGVSALAQLLNTRVVGNFREADTALGGQGAPLVPIFDYEFFATGTDDIIAINIGGMSNLTLLPANCTLDNVKAFDSGPGNVLVDTAMRVLYNRAYDESGAVATTGEIIPALLDMLKSIEFIYQEPPKSTGRETFGIELIHTILDKFAQTHLARDIITTLSYFTAWAIAHNIKLFGKANSEIIVSGGGSHNKYIISTLLSLLPESKIIISDDIGIPADAKEGICFAYLAYRTLGGMTSNIPSVTGASRECILGLVAYP